MGADGWELVAVAITDDYDNWVKVVDSGVDGFKYTFSDFYFKRMINSK